MYQIKLFSFNIFQEHTMVAWHGGRECVVVDPAFYTDGERDEFLSFLDGSGLVPAAILITHAHFDHIFGVAELQRRFGVPVHMDNRELPVLEYNTEMAARLGLHAPDNSFTFTDALEGERIAAAGFEFEVISTPGHAPGAVCYLDRSEKLMFSGDTLFAGTIGRTDLMYSDYDQEIRNIMEKLIVLDPDIRFYPGHGPSSTIGRERTHNPFLEPFNEPEEIQDPDAEPIIINGLR